MKITLQDLYTMKEKIQSNTGIDSEYGYCTLDEFLSDHLDKMDTRARYFVLDILELLLSYRIVVLKERLVRLFCYFLLVTEKNCNDDVIYNLLKESINAIKLFYNTNIIDDIDDAVLDYNNESIKYTFDISVLLTGSDKSLLENRPYWSNIEYIIETDTDDIIKRIKEESNA